MEIAVFFISSPIDQSWEGSIAFKNSFLVNVQINPPLPPLVPGNRRSDFCHCGSDSACRRLHRDRVTVSLPLASLTYHDVFWFIRVIASVSPSIFDTEQNSTCGYIMLCPSTT